MRPAGTSALALVPLAGPAACGAVQGGAEPLESESAAVRTVPFVIDAPCGVQFVTIDGATWRTQLRDDGPGNPPAGWPQSIEGRMQRVDDRTAVFTSGQIPVRLVFHPAPGGVGRCA